MALAPMDDRRRRVLRSIGRSLTINALCPFLLFRILQPRFPSGNVVPLLYATIFPVIGVVLSLVRKRTVDTIAIIAMAGLVLHITVTILARSVGVALAVRSLDGAVVGFVLLISVWTGHPILHMVAKQAITGGKFEHLPSFKRFVETQGKRAFRTLTLVWGACVIAMSGLHVVLALNIPPAEFLLVSPILGFITVIGLLVWTARYLKARMREAGTDSSVS
jgi:hypothetical protein